MAMQFKRLIWTLSGDDPSIIVKCTSRTRKRFAAIGFLVAFIFALCFISFFFAFTNLFQDYFVGVLIGLFFAWMITNIYLFLLYSLSKTAFPYIPNRTARYIATFIRLVFIGFIAVIVSKPVESLLFSRQLASEIEEFKDEKIARYQISTNEHFQEEIRRIKDLLDQQSNLNVSISDERNRYYIDQIYLKEKERDELNSDMRSLVRSSNYYVQGILLLTSKHQWCWFFTFLTIVVFITPSVLKIYLHEDTLFYQIKHDVESKLVEYDYRSFKIKYTNLFKKGYNRDVEYTELYADPPFNTIYKRKQSEILAEDELLKSIYGQI